MPKPTIANTMNQSTIGSFPPCGCDEGCALLIVSEELAPFEPESGAYGAQAAHGHEGHEHAHDHDAHKHEGHAEAHSHDHDHDHGHVHRPGCNHDH